MVVPAAAELVVVAFTVAIVAIIAAFQSSALATAAAAALATVIFGFGMTYIAWRAAATAY